MTSDTTRPRGSATTAAHPAGQGRQVGSTTGSTLAGPMRTQLNKVFPDHWSFMMGEIALYSFIILLLTGTYLTFFFDPSMAETVYHGRTCRCRASRCRRRTRRRSTSPSTCAAA